LKEAVEARFGLAVKTTAAMQTGWQKSAVKSLEFMSALTANTFT
jgi:hypothetical protein